MINAKTREWFACAEEDTVSQPNGICGLIGFVAVVAIIIPGMLIAWVVKGTVTVETMLGLLIAALIISSVFKILAGKLPAYVSVGEIKPAPPPTGEYELDPVPVRWTEFDERQLDEWQCEATQILGQNN